LTPLRGGSYTNEMAEVIKVRCPVCGISRTGRHFGLDDDGEYDADAHPVHTTERIVLEFSGRASIRVLDRGDLTLNQARALRASIQTALDRLDADIASAEDD